jgi:hypothetical protein
MNFTKVARAGKFHGRRDTDINFWTNPAREIRFRKYQIIQERSVTYRFQLHQHPYVQQLLQRLIRSGVAGLQAADTEYHTRARLKTAATAKDSNEQTVQLLVGEVLRLSDGTASTLEGAAVRFAGRRVLKVPEEAVLSPAVDAEVTIPGNTEVQRKNGQNVTLDGNTVASLMDGGPVPVLYSDFFADTYSPNLELVPETDESPHPVKDLDFRSSGAYALYNWEVFFHVPITIAIHLSKNQRYADAQRWFHFIFDPTDDSAGPTPERFWKVRPFQSTDVQKIEEILINLVTGADKDLRDETILSIDEWKDKPFRPHGIARFREQAYMYKAVMAYLDNLIAWGDSLFRQDTGEAIDEALQLYVLAANILGPRPQAVPSKGSVRPQTYDNLRRDLRQFGTVMRDIEVALPFDVMPFPAAESSGDDQLVTVRSLGKALYFGVPGNDKLLGYWDTVADRLFKIRNSLNLQGIFRLLALFAPPIDPGLLARAVGAGLDIGAVVNGLNQPLPLVRFAFLVQKANEMAQEVKSLGGNLLVAMEKEDNEAISILRARHERVIMEMVEQVKYAQLQEAVKSKESLFKSLALTLQRYIYLERQLGKKADEIEKSIPQLDELDIDGLNKLRLTAREPELTPRELEVDIAQDLGDSGGRIVSSYEAAEMEKQQSSHSWRQRAQIAKLGAQAFAPFPDFDIKFHFWGVGGASNVGGGTKLSQVISFAGDAALLYAEHLGQGGNKAAKIGTYSRREQDWAYQSNLAAGEINQIFKQLRAAQIREAIAQQELKSHRQQMKHAEEIEHFLNEEGTQQTGKKTNKALYAWMKREVKGLYAQCFQFAFDLAKKAERALQHELGNPELNYLQFGYLAGKEGLLAGERLYLDIKRMEMAHHELNQREYEPTKHVSMLQLGPMELIKLRNTGSCTLRLPEELFDMDGPGQYFRRIKSVALSIPCVTGPFASVSCKLTLLKSSIRTTPSIEDEYVRAEGEDQRFSDYFGSLQSIVTSSGQNDSGLFETNLRDERYLPFENSGVISEWRLELPADPSKGDPLQFDYETISDVILHIRYTAREGGDLLRKKAIEHLNENITEVSVGSVRLFSVRHEFPTDWAKFKAVKIAGDVKTSELKLELRNEHYPFWSKERLTTVKRLDLLAKTKANTIEITENADQTGKKDTLQDTASVSGILMGQLNELAPEKPVGSLKLFFNDNSMDNLWLVLAWGKS